MARILLSNDARTKSRPAITNRLGSVLDWLAAKPLLSGRQLIVACSYAGIWYPLEAVSSLELQGLVSHVVAPGRIDTTLTCRYHLTHTGIIALARRQAVRTAKVIKKYWLSDGRLATLIRALGHTEACHQFFVDLIAGRDGEPGVAARSGLVLWHGEAEAYRRYRLDGHDRYLRPDAFGGYRSGGQEVYFFLEWDSGNMASARHQRKLLAYRDYQSWWEEQGEGTAFPSTLLIVPSQSQAEAIDRTVLKLSTPIFRPRLPVFLTTHEALKQSGPLRAKWWDVARQRLANPFNPIR